MADSIINSIGFCPSGVPFCNTIYPMPPSVAGRLRFAGRNVTIGFLAD